MQIQNPCSKVLTFFTATLLVLNSYIPNAKADSTEVLESNGIALNLNSIYGYKYGHKNVSQYSKSGEYDPEQQWNLRDLNDGTFLAESVSKPGECVNAHNPQEGSTVNIMPCDRNDPEQKLKKENGSIVLANYNLRLNLGDANDTVVKLTSLNSKVQTPTSNYSSWNEYEYWIVADPETSSGSFLNISGHVFIALIKRNVKELSNGQIIYDGWKSWKTFSFWGRKDIGYYGLVQNKQTELNTINSIINGEVNSKYLVRKAKLSENRANWIADNPGYSGCDSDKYGLNEYLDDSTLCTCVTFATRHWNIFTSGWEDFRPKGVLGRSPLDVSEAIKEINARTNSQFLDDGRSWD
jgi:hypothetical protein